MINATFLAEKFVKGENVYDVDATTWRAAFEYIDLHRHSLRFKPSAVHLVWTVSGGHIRNKIRDDSLILRVLEVAMPGYSGPGLTLYRGECLFLYDQSKIGFCWTPVLDVAKCFARGPNAIESGGVLLKAFAPSGAILAGPNDHSTVQMKEFEYVCNAGKLVNIEVLDRFAKP